MDASSGLRKRDIGTGIGTLKLPPGGELAETMMPRTAMPACARGTRSGEDIRLATQEMQARIPGRPEEPKCWVVVFNPG